MHPPSSLISYFLLITNRGIPLADSFDLDLDQIDLAEPVVSIPRRRPSRRCRGQLFLRGPIPWAWIDTAGRLPGRALLVGLFVWRQSFMRKSATVRITYAQLVKLGMHSRTAKRALRALDRAGLVCVAHWPGCGADVTLLGARKEGDGE